MSAAFRKLSAIVFVAAVAVTQHPSPAPAAETYQYDNLGRLTDVGYANGSLVHYNYDANGNVLSVIASLATAVEGTGPSLQFALGPATPNPGSGPRDLAFTIPRSAHVSLRVFDAAGREVATLLDRTVPAGRFGAHFSTDRWAAGVYYYRLTMGASSRTGRMVVLR